MGGRRSAGREQRHTFPAVLYALVSDDDIDWVIALLSDLGVCRVEVEHLGATAFGHDLALTTATLVEQRQLGPSTLRGQWTAAEVRATRRMAGTCCGPRRMSLPGRPMSDGNADQTNRGVRAPRRRSMWVMKNGPLTEKTTPARVCAAHR